MPEYLQYRYDAGARTTMALYMMVAYVIVFLATVLYSGAVALNTVFDLPACSRRVSACNRLRLIRRRSSPASG